MDVYLRPGDSFWRLSNVFQLPLQLIIDSNPIADPNKLAVGQRIKIPGFTTTIYQIKAGDTLWRIAHKRGITVEGILLTNPGVHPNALQIGQKINIPVRVTWRIAQGKQQYDYTTLINHISSLQQIYPFLQISTIGKSVMGKSLIEIVVGKGPKNVHYNGSFHAQEWITTAVIMQFLNDYLLSITNQVPIRGRAMLPLYYQTSLSLVPMVNPDGVNLVLNGPPNQQPWNSKVIELNNGSLDFSGWKANIRGVDLNNQFPAQWEIEKARKPNEPGPRDYPGDKPLSEPETIAMATLTEQKNFNRVLAFHTQGEVIYWGYENLEPPEARTIVQEFSRVSGYEPVRVIDSYAGYKDWYIQEWKRPGYTVELGTGVNPLPLSQFDEIYEETLGIFLAGLYM